MTKPGVPEWQAPVVGVPLFKAMAGVENLCRCFGIYAILTLNRGGEENGH